MVDSPSFSRRRVPPHDGLLGPLSQRLVASIEEELALGGESGGWYPQLPQRRLMISPRKGRSTK
jgi:hypothetical protein